MLCLRRLKLKACSSGMQTADCVIKFGVEDVVFKEPAWSQQENLISAALLCKAKRQYLLTLQVSRYCLSPLQSSANSDSQWLRLTCGAGHETLSGPRTCAKATGFAVMNSIKDAILSKYNDRLLLHHVTQSKCGLKSPQNGMDFSPLIINSRLHKTDEDPLWDRWAALFLTSP